MAKKLTADMLKKSILQYAVEGKLVEQSKDDEPASVLVEKIRAEKEKLIKEGKIKRNKNESFIYQKDGSFYEKIGKEEKCIDDEIPFDIPESWEWCRLGSVLEKLTDGAHKTPRYVDKGVPFLSVKDISSGKIKFDTCKFISLEEHEKLYARCNSEYGDILLTKVGTTGIPVIVDTKIEFSLFVSVALLKFNKNYIYNKYLQILINSPLVQGQAVKNTKGVGNKNWVMRDIAKTLVVLPPFLEQKRIVAKIEEVLPLVEEYTKKEKELNFINDNFHSMMKKSILQYAVEGKLVAQNKDDEPASVLVERIRTEKEKLIKEGKIKRNKKESFIYRKDGLFYEKVGKEEKCIDDEIPFDIPESWEWCRLGSIGSILTGNTPKTSRLDYYNGDIPFVGPGDISYAGILNYDTKNKLTSIGEEVARIVDVDSIVQVCIGGSLGKVALIDRKIAFNQQINSITSFFNYSRFILVVLSSNFFAKVLKDRSTGTATPIVNKTTWSSILCPIPPLSEQKRIVEKIEEVLPLIEESKNIFVG